MKIIIPGILILQLILLSSCRDNDKDYLKFTANGVPVIEIEEIKETRKITLSDIAEDFHIVRLETNNECLIDRLMRCYISPEYIIVSTSKKGLYLFSNEGKFLNSIAVHGRGPGEVDDSNRNIDYYEGGHKLFTTNNSGGQKKLLCFDLITNEYRNIPLAKQNYVRNIIITSDSTLLLSLMPPGGQESTDCRVYSQNLEGDLLWEINHKSIYGATQGEISQLGDHIYYNYLWGADTLFEINNKELIPKVIFKSKWKQYDPMGNNEVGNIFYGFNMITDNLIMGYYQYITGFEEPDNPYYQQPDFTERKFFMFNTQSNIASLTGRIEDDFLGSEKSFYTPQKDGTFYIRFQATEILELAEKQSRNPDIDPEVKDRVKTLADKLSIDDNPTLLIGKMK